MAARELGHELTARGAAGGPPVAARADRGAWRWPVWLFFGLVGGSIVGLVAAPWPLAEKLYTIVHGLCAQRPSHSFTFGGTRLPFDARMTGIYGGTLLTALFLLARGRARAIRPPRRSVLAALILFIAVMGADGLNSTFKDFGAPYLYEPDNRLRLATGLLMGTTIGVVLGYLLNVTLWAAVAETPLLAGWRELGALLLLEGGFFLIVLAGWGTLYLPVALALVGGAVGAVTALALTFLVLLYGRENRFARPADLAGFASAALLLGYAVLALIAAGRFYLETIVDTSMLT